MKSNIARAEDKQLSLASVQQKPVMLALDDITLDPELQPRQRLDTTTWEEYFHALAEGAVFPPVIVFNDGKTRWLSDGFHRWHAFKAAFIETISAIVVAGSREDALKFSLGANAIHGKRREAGDYSHAYARACQHKLLGPTDVGAVQTLLRCSLRTAQQLTEKARAKADKARDAEIEKRKADGKSNREIARETGVSPSTVDRAVGASKSQTAKMTQPEREATPAEAEPPAVEKPVHPAQAEYNDMVSPRGMAWGEVSEALRAVNLLPSADVLFADRYTRLDHVLGAELAEAITRLTEINRRFIDATSK